MKTIHFKFILTCILCSIFLGNTNAQSSTNSKPPIAELISSGNYNFIAQYAQPLSGSTRYLTSDYDLTLGKDTLSANLPYFGRAYSAPIGEADNGINFTSTNFKYLSSKGKKGSWNITISPKDTRDVRQLYLTVLNDGSASLQIISNSRQSISFTGYITERLIKR